jgi:hypothetical protein
VTTERGPRRDGERAQSNVLGFVLVFALITASVGIVTAAGLPVLEDRQDAERINNMERAFEILDENVDDVVYGEAPSRATEIRLTGGRIDVADSERVEIRVQNSSNASDNATYAAAPRPLAYASEDTTIALSMGSLVRSEPTGSVMLTEPEWLVADDRAVVPLAVTVQGDGTTSLGGRLTVLVVTEAQFRGGDRFTTGPGSEANVTVTVESPRAAAWQRYFESRSLGTVVGATDDSVTYRFYTDELYVPRVRIAVAIRR